MNLFTIFRLHRQYQHQLGSNIAPGSRAEVAYFWLRCGKDQQMRQEFRDRLLSIKSKEQLQEIAGR